MTMLDLEYGPKVAEGKTKVIYALPDSGADLAYMVHKDAITAGDGAKRDIIAGKGELSCRTTTAVFRFLSQHGIATHYVDTLSTDVMLVQRAEMIPIEWVARRIATGSYVRRTGMPEGVRFESLVLEMFLKDDERHDPLIGPVEAVRDGHCRVDEVEIGLETTQTVFLLLEEALARQDVQLVDLKIELGRTARGLVVADVIDNDSWRLWPNGRRELMLDKQVYRDMSASTMEGLESVRRRYVEVARRAELFEKEEVMLVPTVTRRKRVASHESRVATREL